MKNLAGKRFHEWTWRVAVALAVWLVAGCGSSDSGAEDGARQATPKQQIETALENAQTGLTERNGRAVCDELSHAETMQLAASAYQGLATCEGVVEALLKRHPVESGDLPDVASIQIVGQRASVEAKQTGKRVPIYYAFDKERGQWKLATVEVLLPADFTPPPLGPGRDFSDPTGLDTKGKIEEVLYDLQGDFPEELGTSVCYELTAAGQREIEQSGIGSGSCPERVPEITRRAMRHGFKPRASEFLSITVNGKRATALVRDPGRPPYRVPFIKGPDRWAMPSLSYSSGIDLEELR